MKALVAALVSAYVSGEISADEFKAWFIPVTWDMRRFSDPQLADMIRSIQLLIMEFSSGDRTEADFKAQLRPFTSRAQLVDLGSRPSQGTLQMNVKSTSSNLQLVVTAAAA